MNDTYGNTINLGDTIRHMTLGTTATVTHFSGRLIYAQSSDDSSPRPYASVAVEVCG